MQQKPKLHIKRTILTIVTCLVLLSGITVGCTVGQMGSVITENLAPSDMLQIFLGYLHFFGIAKNDVMTNIEMEGVLVDIYVKPLDMVVLLPGKGVETEDRASILEATRKYAVLVWWEPDTYEETPTSRALEEFRAENREFRSLSQPEEINDTEHD